MQSDRLLISRDVLGVLCMLANRPFPCSRLPPSQNESKYETIHMKMSSAYKFIIMQIKLIFI